MMAEKELRPNTQTRGLCSNAEFQPRELSIWPRLFVSYHRRYGHKWAAMLRPLMIRALRLDCAVVHSRPATYHVHEPINLRWRLEKNELQPGARALFLQSPLSSSCVVSELVQVTHQLALHC